MYEEYFEGVSNSSFREFAESSQKALKRLAQDTCLLMGMLNNILNDDVLSDKSESYDFLDKLVIYSDEKDEIYARISVFNERYANRIHYHRWHYSSYILRGGYIQYVYGVMDDTYNDMASMCKSDMLYMEKVGKHGIYSLNNKMIHSINAIPDTISISIRGKALINRFQVMDPKTGSEWWQYGQKSEAFEEHQMKKIRKDTLRERIKRTCKLLEEEL